jgi:rhodanese-related sulfurtransferase
VAATGLSERQARRHGYSVLTALVPGPDRAHYYPTAAPLLLKVVADAASGRLLGLQAVGAGEAVKRADVVATALSLGATLDTLPDLDLGYAPPYASAVDLVAHAANVLRNKRDGLAKTLTPQELKTKLDAGESLVLLDVRTAAEREQLQLRDSRVIWIPLGQLRRRAGELPRDREIVCFCKVSQRGYEAQRLLEGVGLTNVKFLDGGLTAWPYPYESGSA